MYYLLLISSIAIIISFLFNKEKTIKGLKIGLKKFLNIFPTFIIMLILISVVLLFTNDKIISKFLTDNNIYISTLIASFLGSITLMPGFIVFPLCGILKLKGVPYMVISAFTTTLMMVGIITFPIEKEYYGIKVALLRNIISFFIAIFVAVVTGILYAEVF